MILNVSADFAVAARGGNREFLGSASIERNVEIHGERGGVESGPEIGGGGRKPESKW